ncbi:kinase-like domain-containing protein [Nemania serpens]|nr:kinase-like domain-containing protein [Nemania serpens]
MATASPILADPGAGHPAALTRKSSLRSGLRRNTSRSQLSRAESNPAPAAHASRSQSRSQSHSQLPGDSSDDEIPVPMKLSALTKALLNDGGDGHGKEYAGVRTRAQSHRPSSPPAQPEQQKPVKRRSVFGSSVASTGEERRQTRASSAQPPTRQTSPARSQASKDASPVRKRVVRLSTASQASAASAASQFPPVKRRSIPTSASASASLSASQSRARPPSADGTVEDKVNISEIKDKEINTPGQQGRVVRISMGSSGKQGRSSGSSMISLRRAESASRGRDTDVPDEPQTAARHQPEVNLGSVSRPGSNGSRARNDDNQALQSSMRVKRVGKVPGSFLSGPARRGRRRQSEEDNDGELLGSSQDPDDPQHNDLIDMDPVGNLASSYYAPDRFASGSPVSANPSARAGMYRNSPAEEEGDPRAHRKSPEQDEIIIPHYRVPPPRPDIPSRHDQENEAPSTFKREKPAGGLVLEKEFVNPVVRSLSVDANAPRPTSPERKALGSLSHNTPRRAVPLPPPKMSILDAATSTGGAATTSQAARRRNYMKINGKCYTRIDCIGRGGSGKVYRVAADNGHMFALKRVSIENADEHTVKGYKGEIDLLKKLTKVERVITLFDYEMNDEKKVLSLLMEMGELDLYTLLKKRFSPDNSSENAKFDPVFVRYYWQEMLECLAAVHAYDIVHSDLKPANFVLVQGRLKLIDFGIANAIQTEETVNVHREAQIGTPNYMSPESLIDANATDLDGRRIANNSSRPRLMKLGKPSDIWSLGCILFQMVYGVPPFGHISNQMARCHAIINWQYDIEFRERGIGDVPVPPSLLRTMKRCLSRDQRLRPTCEELLSPTDPFLYPIETPDGALPITEELLGRIIQSVVTRCRERMPSDAEVLSLWPQAYWGSVAKAIGQDARSAEGR